MTATGSAQRRRSFEFWHALKAQGAETKLVDYANGGRRRAERQLQLDLEHDLIRLPDHRQDIIPRQMAWFEEQTCGFGGCTS